MELKEVSLEKIRIKGNFVIKKLKFIQESCLKKDRKYMIFVLLASPLMVVVFLLNGSVGSAFTQGLSEVNETNSLLDHPDQL
jgi:hypothetical protein